jgi:hypothetical protein
VSREGKSDARASNSEIDKDAAGTAEMPAEKETEEKKSLLRICSQLNHHSAARLGTTQLNCRSAGRLRLGCTLLKVLPREEGLRQQYVK